MATPGPTQLQRERVSTHEGFLRHANFRWLKISLIVGFFATAIYILHDPEPRPDGGSWYGYTLGTIGAGLIVWLSLLGLRKRAMTRGRWSLKAWTSAHVYLGLSLIVIATLHTGFQLGWNVHTLAYVLMLLVIASGVYGIIVYATLPRAMSDNRSELTQAQMLDNLRMLDRQLHDAAQPLDQRTAAIVRQSLDDDPFARGFLRRLSSGDTNCGTRAAQLAIRQVTGPRAMIGNDPLEKIDILLERKEAQLAQIRRHMRIKALLEIWLYVHVPLTFALLAALTAHIISVFFYW